MEGDEAEALQQIKERHYADKYIHMAGEKGMAIILIGLSFSSSERCIAEWKEEILEL